MSLAIGLVALAVWSGEPPETAEGAWIGYTIRTVETPAVEWRRKHGTNFKLLGWQGTSQVWTASTKTIESLIQETKAESILAPRITAASGATTVVDTQVYKTYEGGVDRPVDEPMNRALVSGYLPGMTAVLDGYRKIGRAHV